MLGREIIEIRFGRDGPVADKGVVGSAEHRPQYVGYGARAIVSGTDADGRPDGRDNLCEALNVIRVAVGYQYGLYGGRFGLRYQRARVLGGIDDDALVSLRTHQEIGVVVVGAALQLEYPNIVIFVVCSHYVSPVPAGLNGRNRPGK